MSGGVKSVQFTRGWAVYCRCLSGATARMKAYRSHVNFANASAPLSWFRIRPALFGLRRVASGRKLFETFTMWLPASQDARCWGNDWMMQLGVLGRGLRQCGFHCILCHWPLEGHGQLTFCGQHCQLNLYQINCVVTSLCADIFICTQYSRNVSVKLIFLEL